MTNFHRPMRPHKWALLWILAALFCTAGAYAQTWSNRDIGTVGAVGSTDLTAAPAVIKLKGAGADIWGNADAFQFAYQVLHGDGQIIARVDSQQNTHQWAKAGIMIRETLTATSRNAAIVVTPSNSLAFQRRTVAGPTIQTSILGAGAPFRMKLVRLGNTISAYAARDGDDWVYIGEEQMAMGADVYVGLAVTSHTAGVLSLAQFSDVTLSNTIDSEQWTSRSIGSLATLGGANYDAANNAFHIHASGADIWGGKDNFHYLHKRLSGNGQLTARVSGITSGDAIAKAGVMLRSTEDQSSANVMMDVTPGSGSAFQRRISFGLSTLGNAQAGVAPPQWLKLVRSGDDFSGYTSADGHNWLFVGAQTMVAPLDLMAGMAFTNHTNGPLGEAVFESFEIEREIEPFGWLGQNIGSSGPALIGSSLYDPLTGKFTVNGIGADISNAADAFQFAFQPMSGECEIQGRILSQQNTASWAKAGIMLRESTAANARNVMLGITPTKGLFLQSRSATGATTVRVIVANTYTLPCWLKLRHAGGQVTAYTSANGQTWQQAGTVNLSFDRMLGGLAVTSFTTTAVSTAQFDSVTRKFIRAPWPGMLNLFCSSSTAAALRWSLPPNTDTAKFELYSGSALVAKTSSLSTNLLDLSAGTPYEFTLRSLNNYGQVSGPDQLLSLTTPQADVLPQPWRSIAFGTPPPRAGANFSEGGFALFAAKAAGAIEAGEFVYRTAWGDLDFSAEIRTSDDTPGATERTLMLREDLNAGGRFLSIGLGGVAQRAVSGAAVNVTALPAMEGFSGRLRVTRQGNSIQAFRYSTAGVEKPVWSGTFNLPQNIFAGLSLSLTGDSARNGLFQDVSFAGGEPDSDGDGIPDQWELDHGLSPTDPADALIDVDGDGLTNLQKFLRGKNPVASIFPINYSPPADGQFPVVFPAFFSVDLNGPATYPVTVHYRISGTAKLGINKTDISATVTIPAGSTSASVRVDPITDSPTTIYEHAVVKLSPAAAYTLGDFFSAQLTVCHVPPAGPVGIWHFDEATGSTAADSSGKGNNGSLVNGTLWTIGLGGKAAVKFDGVDDTVQVPHSDSLNLNGPPMTVSSWIKPAALTGLPGTILAKGTAGGTRYRFTIAGGLKHGLAFTISTDTTEDEIIPVTDQSAVIADGNWHHVAFVRDSLSQGTLYLDGIAVGANPFITMPPNSTAPLIIGGSSSGEYFKGAMDDVRIYNLALSAQEIAALHDTDGDANGVPDYWDEFAGKGADTDGDGISDSAERVRGTDPFTKDAPQLNLSVFGFTAP